MTLRVPYDGFAEAVKRHLSTKDIYLHSVAGKVVLSAGDAPGGVVVLCSVRKPESEVRTLLHEAGFKVHSGMWSADDDEEILGLPHFAAVSYRANKSKTGVWVEVYDSVPTEQQALEDFVKEMKEELVAVEITFDDFVTSCQASVLVLRADQIEKMGMERDA